MPDGKRHCAIVLTTDLQHSGCLTSPTLSTTSTGFPGTLRRKDGYCPTASGTAQLSLQLITTLLEGYFKLQMPFVLVFWLNYMVRTMAFVLVKNCTSTSVLASLQQYGIEPPCHAPCSVARLRRETARGSQNKTQY